jgi:hypothetical protein
MRISSLALPALFDLPTASGPDEFVATKAIPAAANKSAPAHAKRTAEEKRFRLNECVFILIGAD